ncbi:hypothetical protein BPAE_0018g00570 [Botrytis paeoniae]|uniref:Delta 8-(E)-sphingolipid desaturase n=1 Tax=Botrytis paeoniae TaxID=278948 RepID=A0A4Z1G2E1_9HELO|nr:hypothetical protein BPAE_0018g00570 [Botrytis paeoniae]
MTFQPRIIPRPEIESMISHGHKIFILDNSVPKADAWLPYHPGGEKSIMHMIGRDATDEINALHSEGARERGTGNGNGNGKEKEKRKKKSTPHTPRSPNSALKSTDLSKYPSLDPKSQDEIIFQYRQLDQKLRSEGLYNCPYSSYGIDILRYTLLFTLFWRFLQSSHYIFSALSLGLSWHQLVFTAHDAGHLGITHSLHLDSCIWIFIADFLGGLSIGWWKRNHNIHHIATNSPEHDPDIAHLPFFAISPLRESFAMKMVRTTMDVECPPWMDFLHGGLQFQVAHHLFPRLPRHHLRKAQKYVREFCEDVGIPYVSFGFVRGNREVIGRLSEVAGYLRVLEECRKVAARDLMEGHVEVTSRTRPT